MRILEDKHESLNLQIDNNLMDKFLERNLATFKKTYESLCVADN